MRPSWTLSLALLAAPCAVGAAVMNLALGERIRVAMQLGAVGLGALLSSVARRTRIETHPALPFVLPLLFVAGTRAVSGIDGVHRWYGLGPVRLHASALVAPWIVVAATRRAETDPRGSQAALVALNVVHLAQPDAGQATAVTAAAMLLAARTWGGLARMGLMLSHLALLAAVWTRRDPLGPVAFVEDAVARAFAFHPVAGVLALASLGGAVFAPRVAAASVGDRHGGDPLAAYVLGALAATVVGAFPVPCLGFGMSPIVGMAVALGALAVPPPPVTASRA